MNQPPNELELARAQGLGKSYGLGAQAPADASEVASLLAKSPQLALARAMRWPMVPFVINVVGTFSTTTAGSIPAVTGDSILSQDAIVDSVVVRVVNKNALSGQLDSLRDFFSQYQNGIQATCAVVGAGSGQAGAEYMIAPFFTYVSALFDVTGGGWPRGWVLRDGQTVSMQYNAPFTLNVQPLDVATVIRMYQPAGSYFRRMVESQAFDQLDKLGYDTCSARDCRGLSNQSQSTTAPGQPPGMGRFPR